MAIADVSQVLLYCLAVNYGVLILWFAMFSLAHDFVYRLHSRWFTLSLATFDAIHYGSMAFYKVAVFLFVLAPWVALRLLDSA